VFRNSDDAIRNKVRAVLNHNMKPILCIGETKEEYDAGLVESVGDN
jgi:triosephosphate isomerase (TIM)